MKKEEEKTGKRISPSKGAGIMDTLASTSADLLLQHDIPWMGKKLSKWIDIMGLKH